MCFPALAYITYQFDTIPPLQCYTPESLLTLFLYTADSFLTSDAVQTVEHAPGSDSRYRVSLVYGAYFFLLVA